MEERRKYLSKLLISADYRGLAPFEKALKLVSNEECRTPLAEICCVSRSVLMRASEGRTIGANVGAILIDASEKDTLVSRVNENLANSQRTTYREGKRMVRHYSQPFYGLNLSERN